MTAIALVPIAIDEEDKKIIFSPLVRHLASTFDTLVNIISDQPASGVIRLSFNEQRNQANSDKLLHWLETNTMNNIKYLNPTKTIILGICDLDAYSLGLNFVFGQASLTGGVAAIYLPRLRQEFYGLGADTSIFIERVLKEATHELGHVLGLNHCPKRPCVMYFSSMLIDTDRKGKDFCNMCSNKLRQK